MPIFEKATNYDVYKGIIKKFIDEGSNFGLMNGIPVRCCDMHCSDCDICPDNCQLEIVRWLYDEFDQKKVDWSNVKMDARVMVSGNGVDWYHRHFAGYEDGKIYVWNGGATSWTKLDYKDDNVDGRHSWKYTILC